MTLLITGCGSIGSRHARNVISLGETVLLHDVNPVSAVNLAQELNAKKENCAGVADSLAQGIAQKPFALLVCTPPNDHVAAALIGVNANIPIFIEKPLCHDDNVNELVRIASERNIPVMVACNMRFTEGLQKVKSIIPLLGKLWSARIEFGYDLRLWRPGSDYSKNYAASWDTGGGIVLDAVHELDYALWLFGEVKKSFSNVGKSSILNIETEDWADFLLFCERCPSVSIHVDYLQPEYTRFCVIHGENGSVWWDFKKGTVRTIIAGKESVVETNTDINAMYVEEIKHFLNAVRNKTPITNPLSEAARTHMLALELRKKGLATQGLTDTQGDLV